ncbi:MAG: zinc-binding dehydrogenase [Methylotenera sp.]|nr:zinc-binding dehydrogenase [Oligoflexia bacterium]
MRAWRIEAHGGSEVFKISELPIPIPGPLEVRIKVQAVGLNHLDVWVRKGVPGHHFPLPLTPGSDIAGIIDTSPGAFGAGAEQALNGPSNSLTKGLKAGSAIIVNPGTSCGHCKHCLGGFDPLCPEYGIFGETRDGGCADYICVPVANIIARPSNVSAVEAAALQIPFLTAWSMLTRKAKLQPGESILIHAGGSGVSVAAIQMAKFLGAHVITTVGHESKVAKAKALGADHVIEYRKTPFRAELKKILVVLKKKGVEVVIDHVGADTFSESIKSLAWGGRLVTCGATSGSDVQIDLKAIFFKNISILGSTMGSKADLIQVVDLVSQEKFRAVIDSVHPMSKLPEALALIESRNIFGKVVVTSEAE